MKARFSTEARNDLQEIADYIAADSPRRARSFIRELRIRAIEVARNPQAYSLVESQSHRGIRRRLHGAYLILYRMSEGRLDILRIVHGARDYPNLLDDPPET